MGGLFTIAGLLLGLVGLVCAIILLIDAFKNAIWKGILGFFCFPYLIYYAFAEYQSDNKMLIVMGYLVGAVGGVALRVMGAAMH
jgi:hypothetical protein